VKGEEEEEKGLAAKEVRGLEEEDLVVPGSAGEKEEDAADSGGERRKANIRYRLARAVQPSHLPALHKGNTSWRQ